MPLVYPGSFALGLIDRADASKIEAPEIIIGCSPVHLHELHSSISSSDTYTLWWSDCQAAQTLLELRTALCDRDLQNLPFVQLGGVGDSVCPSNLLPTQIISPPDTVEILSPLHLVRDLGRRDGDFRRVGNVPGYSVVGPRRWCPVARCRSMLPGQARKPHAAARWWRGSPPPARRARSRRQAHRKRFRGASGVCSAPPAARESPVLSTGSGSSAFVSSEAGSSRFVSV